MWDWTFFILVLGGLLLTASAERYISEGLNFKQICRPRSVPLEVAHLCGYCSLRIDILLGDRFIGYNNDFSWYILRPEILPKDSRIIWSLGRDSGEGVRNRTKSSAKIDCLYSQLFIEIPLTFVLCWIIEV